VALKKVRRPVLFRENELTQKRGWNNVMLANKEFEETTDESKNDWNNVLMPSKSDSQNYIDSEHNDSIDETEKVYESNKVTEESALNRVISFFEENVRLPRRSKIEEGNYAFRIDNITSKENIEGKFGRYDQFLITFSICKSGMGVPVQITLPYTITSKPESQLMLFLASFKSIFVGQKITIKQLVGIIGNCQISHFKTASGDVYERLVVTNVESSN
jgi:hypothetical protein